jgi:hypothetical protein
MALSKVNFNSMNVTPSASKAIKFNSSNNGLETGDLGGNLVLLATQTASSSATLSFTSSIDSTYKEYIFKCISMHPASDSQRFQFQADTGTNTNYNQTITSTSFRASHTEADATAGPSYKTATDQAQGTAFQTIGESTGNANDESTSGTLHVFEPSSTTFVKHFFSEFNSSMSSEGSNNQFSAGYFNTTTALTRFQFKFASGDIDSGTIKMYGVL